MRKKLLLLVLNGFALLLKAGTLVVSSASLFSFGNCPVFYLSDAQRYTLSGTGLTQPVFISAPEHFEISTSYLGSYSSNLQLNPSSGTLATTTIFARFSPYAAGSQSGNIIHSSAGCTTQNKAVSGSASSTPSNVTGSASYYNTIGTGLSGSGLKTALYSLILGHTAIPYGSGSSGLWATYSTTDPFYNGKVWDIYSTRMDANSPFEFVFSVDQCGTYATEGDCYNREHSFPQSWFNSSTPMVSDMYHIYPTDGKVNGVRNNYPFGEVSSPTYTSLQGAKLGPNTSSGYTGVVFEPLNDYKGDLARSFLYMATRYENLIAGWQSNGNANDVLAGNSFPAYDAWFLNLLLKWHQQDPPGSKEINRNNSAFGYQGNRNPFIDSPQYVNRIWGGASALEPTQASSNFVVKSNTLNSAILGWKTGNGQRRLVVARAGAPVNVLPTDSTSYIANPVFGLGANLGSGNFVVYNGMGANMQVSGLNTSQTYYFLVVEYNGTGKGINYLSSSTLASSAINLPVEWQQFEGRKIHAGRIDLFWTTATETNNAYFEVERKNAQGNFESIGKLAGKGNATTVSRYTFSDLNFYTQVEGQNNLVYRIKQTDFDGRFHYSEEIVVSLMEEKLDLEILNPIENSLLLRTPYEGLPVRMVLSDTRGKILIDQKTFLTHETFIPIEVELPAGLYVLSVVQRSGNQNFKIIKH